MVLSEDSGNFKFGPTKLPDEGKAKIDEMISKLLADPKGAYFEIEGHTDNVGGTDINKKIGMERAEAVKAYLYEQHKIPLHRMNVDQLRRRQAGRRTTTRRRPRAEPPRRHSRAGLRRRSSRELVTSTNWDWGARHCWHPVAFFRPQTLSVQPASP